MGDQLWTSLITGHRRRRTRLSELRSLTEIGITAHAILEPLKSCPAELPALEAAQMLRRRDFDVAGEKESAGEEAIGWVMRDDLKNGSVVDHKRSLTASKLIADSTPLSGVLDTLKKRQFTFVMIGSELRCSDEGRS